MQLFIPRLCSLRMNTFLKVIIVVIAAVLIAHFWPLALLPLLIAAGAVILIGALTAGGAAVVFSVICSILGVAIGLVCTVAAVLSPVWIPLLLVVGLIALIRRSSGATA